VDSPGGVIGWGVACGWAGRKRQAAIAPRAATIEAISSPVLAPSMTPCLNRKQLLAGRAAERVGDRHCVGDRCL
jgi:hypothetical protein